MSAKHQDQLQKMPPNAIVALLHMLSAPDSCSGSGVKGWLYGCSDYRAHFVSSLGHSQGSFVCFVLFLTKSIFSVWFCMIYLADKTVFQRGEGDLKQS